MEFDLNLLRMKNWRYWLEYMLTYAEMAIYASTKLLRKIGLIGPQYLILIQTWT